MSCAVAVVDSKVDSSEASSNVIATGRSLGLLSLLVVGRNVSRATNVTSHVIIIEPP